MHYQNNMLCGVDARWENLPLTGVVVPENMIGDEVSSGVTPADTISISELKNIKAYTHVRTGVHDNREYFFRNPGDPSYFLYPFNWTDLPRNHLEDAGTISMFDARTGTTPQPVKTAVKSISGAASIITGGFASIGKKIVISGENKLTGKVGVDWKGKAFFFKDPIRYLNTLALIETPKEYIRYLKFAPLAGFNLTDPNAKARPRGYYANVQGLTAEYPVVLPPEALGKWWLEVITWHILSMSFDMLRIAQIEDYYDLQAAYDNAGKAIDALRAEMLAPEFVDTIPANKESRSVTVSLELQPWQIEALESGIKEVYAIYNENRKKMAEGIIELSNVDAKIVPTNFSTDPYQNPYLVFNPERSQEAGQPIFTNIARNLTANFNPPEVAMAPEALDYWKKVPDYMAQHERNIQSEYGPLSQADIDKYGIAPKKTNWIPWIIAGGAAAYAASQML